MEHLELSIIDLLLDEDNPRLGSVANQSEALEELIRLNDGHFRNLMLSIKQNGLDPGDSLYVIEAENAEDYVVLEGNRRLSALMVLDNPNLLNGTDVSDSIKSSLTRAAKGFELSAVEPIRCVCFDQRTDANEWIYRRHTGSAEGEGRIQWGPLEVQRFSGDRSVLDLIDFVGRNDAFTDEEWQSTKATIESRKSSNLARLLESKAGRDHLGLSVAKSSNENVPMLSSDPSWALQVLKRLIEDVRDGVIDSRNMNKASEIKAYFENLPEDLRPSAKTKASIRPVRELNISTGGKTKAQKTTTSTAKKGAKTKIAPRPRKNLAPKKHPFKNPSSTKGQDLLREASLLDADKFKISAAFVLRAFVELAVHDYMKANEMPFSEKDAKGETKALDLATCADRVVTHIVQSGLASNADLRGFKNGILKKSSPASIQSLSNFVHNRYQIPVPDALRAGWESCVPVFIAAFGEA